MNPSLKRQLLRTLSKMLSDLKNPKEIELFLSDFFEDSELEKYIKRLAIAYWLKKGRDVENIKTNLLATGKEITETQKLLKTNGLKLAIKNIESDEWANQWAEKIQALTKK